MNKRSNSTPARGARRGDEPGLVEKVVRFLGRDVWRLGPEEGKPLLHRTARILYLACRGLWMHSYSRQAAALTYMTVMSLVPLLAFAFSVAKGFGLYEKLAEEWVRPFLDYAFGKLPDSMPESGEVVDAATAPPELPLPDGIVPTPDGAAAADAAGALEIRYYLENLLEIVNQTDFAGLGTFGLVVLLFTAIRLLMDIEAAMNEIFGVTEGRPFMRKVADYVALLVAVPILAVTATAASSVGVERVVGWLGLDLDLGPIIAIAVIVLIWTVFTLIYQVMPNTRVPLFSSILGGVVGGTLFHVVNLLYVWFQREVANYSAVYAGFAAVPIFLVWIFTAWVAVLLGAYVAWAHMAEPGMREIMKVDPLRPVQRENLAVRAAHGVAGSFLRSEEPPDATELATRLAVPLPYLDEVLQLLVVGGILARTDRDGIIAYLPARDPGAIRVQDVVDALDGAPVAADNGSGDPAEQALETLRREARESHSNRTLRELAGEA